MEIKGYSWAGTPTSDFNAAMKFFGEVLGLPLLAQEENREIGMFQLPSGQLFEVFGKENKYHSFMKGPTIAFDVPDVRQAREELEAKGVEFVTGIDESPKGEKWSYFVGPDGNLYEIWQRGAR